ncbi:uncharacterized protein [Diadema antillarum]|uniref:uncharacterized protein n=1 Tax=Diadema antillarum TaxID=105358 RepID=UPI003A874A96
MKITFSKMSTGTTLTTTQAGQKVIIVSSANSTSQSQTLSSDAILHRSHSLPPSSKVSMATASESQATSSSHPLSLEEAMPAISTSGQPAMKHHRSKSGSKQKAPKPTTVVQRTEGPALSTSTSVTGAGGSGVVPAVIGASGKRASQTSQRPEPGMKLITQTVASSGGRMPSKAYQVSSTTTSSPTVRTTTIALPASKTSVSAGEWSSSPIMGVRNLVSTTGPRIVTVPSPITGRSPPTMSNVITLSPMALQKSGAKSTTTTVVVTKPGTVPGKTNVIVVQKSQVKSKTISSSRSTAPGIMTITTSILTRPKIAMTMTSGNPGVVPLPSTSLGSPSPSIRFPSPSVSAQKTVRGPSPVGAGTPVGGTLSRGRSPTSPLSVGQVIGSKGQVMMRPKSPIAQTIATLSAPRSPLPTNPEMQAKIKGHRRSSSKSPPGQSSQKLVESLAGGVVRTAKMAGRESSLIFQTGNKPNTEWIEYDGSPPASQSASSAIKALLEFKSQPPPAPASVKQVSIPGVIPGMMPSAARHLSTVATTTTTSTAAGGQPKEPTKNPSIVTVEVQGGSAERLEFSTEQLSSVVDQFEQFLESEEKEEKKEGKDSDSELRRRLMAPSLASTSKEKAVTVSKVSPPPFKLEGAKEVKGGVPDPKEEHTGVDPFEFVEEGVSTKEPTPVRKATHKQEPHRSAATEAKEPSERVSTEGAKAEVQQAPAVSLVTQGPRAGPLASVVMESSSSFDITQMNLEDLSCQRMQEEEEEEEEEEGEAEEEEGEEKREDDPSSSGEMLSFQEASSGGSGSEGVVGADGTVRVSRRKRKAPTPIDEETGPSSMPSWARAAWNLLQRVMRFRGANRPKGGINAASWFTRPVDPLEAPGYHKLIKKPMDFGTIKRNLEAGTYLDFGEFHQDMMLVRSNCLQYNPAGHAARRDCEEVFQFYSSEYSKTLDRWQKQMLVVPKSPKRLRTEPPPQP